MKSENSTENVDKPQVAVSSTDWLAELDQLYKRYREVEHVAVWGGSFEREHGARMELKPIVNKMFDTLLKLLQERSANDGVELPTPATQSLTKGTEK